MSSYLDFRVSGNEDYYADIYVIKIDKGIVTFAYFLYKNKNKIEQGLSTIYKDIGYPLSLVATDIDKEIKAKLQLEKQIK